MRSRLEALLAGMAARGAEPCLLHRDGTASYGDVTAARVGWEARLAAEGIGAGDVVGLRSDHSTAAVALLLALLRRGAIVALVPRTGSGDRYLAEAGAKGMWRADGHELVWEPGPARPVPDLARRLAEQGRGGLVIFTSGSTGRPRAALHDIERFLLKFEGAAKARRTVAFLLFDHVAGLDTLFYTLAAGGALVLLEGRSPDEVGRAVARHRAEVLPASPTFLRLLCLAGTGERFDLSSLRILTWGSEPMDPATLSRVVAAFPDARVIQKYGTTEFGSPRSRTREHGSLWLRLDDGRTETRVVDGTLWVRSPGTMLGYLNAPAPLDGDGWYCTGDRVEQDGPWLRILGRASELINVGGEKVLPQEVEGVILELPWVAEAVVHGTAHALTGQVVAARVRVAPGAERPEDLRKAVRLHCIRRLPRHAVPVAVEEVRESLRTAREKTVGRMAPEVRSPARGDAGQPRGPRAAGWGSRTAS